MAIHSVKDTSARIEHFRQERENPKATAKLYFVPKRGVLAHSQHVENDQISLEPLCSKGFREIATVTGFRIAMNLAFLIRRECTPYTRRDRSGPLRMTSELVGSRHLPRVGNACVFHTCV